MGQRPPPDMQHKMRSADALALIHDELEMSPFGDGSCGHSTR